MTLIAEVREKKLLIRISVNLPTPDHPLPAPPRPSPPLPAPPLSIIHSTKKNWVRVLYTLYQSPLFPLSHACLLSLSIASTAMRTKKFLCSSIATSRKQCNAFAWCFWWYWCPLWYRNIFKVYRNFSHHWWKNHAFVQIDSTPFDFFLLQKRT